MVSKCEYNYTQFYEIQLGDKVKGKKLNIKGLNRVWVHHEMPGEKYVESYWSDGKPSFSPHYYIIFPHLVFG